MPRPERRLYSERITHNPRCPLHLIFSILCNGLLANACNRHVFMLALLLWAEWLKIEFCFLQFTHQPGPHGGCRSTPGPHRRSGMSERYPAMGKSLQIIANHCGWCTLSGSLLAVFFHFYFCQLCATGHSLTSSRQTSWPRARPHSDLIKGK
ncbi:hypothetical protein QBC38DRAFT_159046 [Podospora fimiseda]|uniref:Uncharacterized protein n=1 Tax=Podospora fimiseda TaxID=252190 RepID=A0AAN7BSM1_9PEZI|nr:hypothetical protein QBC38DRAFT_159046 [Podospora fimiseda]